MRDLITHYGGTRDLAYAFTRARLLRLLKQKRVDDCVEKNYLYQYFSNYTKLMEICLFDIAFALTSHHVHSHTRG